MTEGSDKIDRVDFEIGEGDDLKGATMGRLQADFGRTPRLEGLLPTGCAEAPAVARLESGEPEFRPWRGEVIAPGPREFQELRSHYGADGVRTDVRGVGFAASATEPAGFRRLTTVGEGLAEHVDLPVLTVAAAVHGEEKGTSNPSDI